ncbi:MAG: hypothetical protein E7441_02345 [Ruminococcaceae bacterium]|nr:hypothetical protein [Oscillospiraceae bacterium]
MNTLKISHAARKIVMDRTFAKRAENTMSPEYAHLQQVRKDYPEYSVVLRTIKKNHKKNTYRGLTYEYMYDYISTNKSLSPKEKESIAEELSGMIQISKCQALQYRYPVIKKWFIEKFPEIKKFAEIGVKIQEEEKKDVDSAPALIKDVKIA